MLDPARVGFQRLIDVMRIDLNVKAEAINLTTLEPLGFIRADAFDAAS